jgi:hypothetical protein
MKKFVGFFVDYFRKVSKALLIAAVLFTAASIYINYHFHLFDAIEDLPTLMRFLSWWLVFTTAFSFGYIILKLVRKQFKPGKIFLLFLFTSTAAFALKMAIPIRFSWSTDPAFNDYVNAVVYFPLKLVLMLCILWMLWKCFDSDQPFYGSRLKGFNAKPYLVMLLVMCPIIVLASLQKDFQSMYPKVDHLPWFANGNGNFCQKLLYEISYGTDFVSIEFFFRGFLVLGFVKWAGKDAILPMAIFYCTIHFGKPLGECISSFFGGILLGIITCHTRSIYGGLIAHLGIAWLMELVG